MSQSITTPSLPAALRRFAARTWADPESRSTLVGVTGVIFFYLLLWLISPYLFRVDPITASARRPRASPQPFSIELAPDAFIKPTVKPPPPNKFVETNPDAPENIPDKTTNFAAQNQQVAQEKPTPDGKNDMPATRSGAFAKRLARRRASGEHSFGFASKYASVLLRTWAASLSSARRPPAGSCDLSPGSIPLFSSSFLFCKNFANLPALII
jgi:hypothetical protein